MRTINASSCILLAGFALVQYNDPDAIVWFATYAVPAIWAGLAAFRPQRLAPSPRLVSAYGACLAAAITGSLWWWPSLPAGWIHIETEREGLGILIATVALALVGFAWWHRARRWRPLLP
jgi:hypothetical protein